MNKVCDIFGNKFCHVVGAKRTKFAKKWDTDFLTKKEAENTCTHNSNIYKGDRAMSICEERISSAKSEQRVMS